MNRQLFLQMLEHPDSVSEQENIALQKFTQDFPYCQTGQLLFTKHLHSQQSVHYPEQLKLTAAYAADRKVLYNLIHTTTPFVTLPHGGREFALTEDVEEETPSSQTSLVEEEKPTEEIVAEVPDTIIPEKKITEENTQADIIQQRLQEIASKKTNAPVPDFQNKKEEVKSEPLSFKEDKPVEEQKIVQPKIREEKKEEDRQAGKHSFTEWLKTVKKEPGSNPAEQERSASSVTPADEIIDRFIETEPRIIPSKAEFYNPIKMAKQSLEEHDDLVSETLAGIFAEQGNLPRAIEMYKKLMLAIPEKSSFFAARIEKLTQQLNEGK
jgi:hypothetical protein